MEKNYQLLLKITMEITSGLSYSWYRLRDKNDEMAAYGTKIGTSSTYKLKDNDKDEYIGVSVSYKGEKVTDITGKITEKSSQADESEDNEALTESNSDLEISKSDDSKSSLLKSK